MDARLKSLIAFGADIFIVDDHENIRLWQHGSGFDAAGLDYLIKTRTEYYVRRQREHRVKEGDRVAVRGRGIAVVEQTEDKEVVIVWGTRDVLRIARKDIVWNQQNMRWEFEAKNASQPGQCIMRERPVNAMGQHRTEGTGRQIS
jgi:hypothetical protein